MAHGRIRRTARRGIAVAVLGWLSIAAATVALAPSAAAAPTATVPIRDLTQLVVSVDKGGSVTFVNELQPKPLKVGGTILPALVDVTAYTEVTLTLPSGERKLPAGARHTETFQDGCGARGCWLTFTYRFETGASLTQGLIDLTTSLLPPLPRPQPLIVNTLIPLPNLPGVNLPQLPPLQVPPSLVPGGGGGSAPTAPGPSVPAAPSAQPSAPAPTAEGVPGSQYTYDTGQAAAQMAPGGAAASAALDPSRFFVPGRNASGGGAGAGGVAGGYDGASVPVFGQLAGLDGSDLDGEGTEVEAQASGRPAEPLPAAALAAVVALSAVTAALVRTHQASRAGRSSTR